MGIVHAEITLKNSGDVAKAQGGFIPEREVREVRVRALVDTGAGTLVINEEIMCALGLGIRGLRRASFANNAKEICKVTDPVDVYWKERGMTCQALVVPDTPDVLLGAIPLEDMDLIVNPSKQELVGAHGDEVVTSVV
ncbi:MAG: aspartyl protease family protein [Treponema sp.]|jgi:clan AA aspartic protease|nr:aspartyl protease family protein [Treponema sp.]